MSISIKVKADDDFVHYIKQAQMKKDMVLPEELYWYLPEKMRKQVEEQKKTSSKEKEEE